jgi:hypothetical protein
MATAVQAVDNGLGKRRNKDSESRPESVDLRIASSCSHCDALYPSAAGLTPPMGWNSWNHYACNVSDELIRSTARTIVSSGLAKAGYEYINIDDCWQVRDTSGRRRREGKKSVDEGRHHRAMAQRSALGAATAWDSPHEA